VASVVDTTHLVLTNLGVSGNSSPSSSIPSGSQVSPVSTNDVVGVLPASNQQAQSLSGDLAGAEDPEVVGTWL